MERSEKAQVQYHNRRHAARRGGVYCTFIVSLSSSQCVNTIEVLMCFVVAWENFPKEKFAILLKNDHFADFILRFVFWYFTFLYSHSTFRLFYSELTTEVLFSLWLEAQEQRSCLSAV